MFQDTRTPLQSWFYAIYLFVTTRHGVSGEELQRQLGVTYRTAWRMGMKIRELIGSGEDFDMLWCALPPGFRTVLSWNFPLMIPVSGEGEFLEGIEVLGGADRLCLEAG